jgi:hypothetical protein
MIFHPSTKTTDCKLVQYRLYTDGLADRSSVLYTDGLADRSSILYTDSLVARFRIDSILTV